MKTIMYFFRGSLMILPFLFFTFSLQATTITWLGANGDWHDAANWDTGNVPTLSDEVIIPSGRAKIYNGDTGNATNIIVQSGARLYVYNGGELEVGGIIDKDGISNSGRIYIFGDLIVHEILSNTGYHNGIYTNNYFYISSNGSIHVYDVEGTGISNYSNGYFYNRGLIHIENVDKSNIKNHDRFRNTGTMDIDVNNIDPNYGLVNYDDFRNYSTGDIDVDGGGGGGITNGNANAHFRNYGSISIENSNQVGFVISGTLTNYDGGLIDTRYNTSNGIHNNGTILNNGIIHSLYNSYYGFYNNGIIENNNHLLAFANSSFGFKIYTGANLENNGSISSSYNGGNGLYIQGTLENTIDGLIGISDKISIMSSGELNNAGMIDTDYTSGTHYVQAGATLTNTGAIEDKNENFTTTLDNQQVVFHPVAGTLQNGVPFSNILNMVDLSNVIIGNWKTTQSGGTIAGTYDDVTNEFTPNANAIGLTTLHVSVQIIGGSLTRNFELKLDNPVAPFKRETQASFFINSDENGQFDGNKLKSFPNPTTGTVNFNSKMFDELDTQIKVFNSIGQLVWNENLPSGGFQKVINFPNHLNNGNYIIHIMQNGKSIAVENIQLQR